MTNLDPILLGVIAGALGGMSGAFLGWLSSDEPFKPRKFLSSVLTAAVSGVAIGVGAQISPNARDVILVFLAAMGIDAARHRVTGIVRKPKPA